MTSKGGLTEELIHLDISSMMTKVEMFFKAEAQFVLIFYKVKVAQ